MLTLYTLINIFAPSANRTPPHSSAEFRPDPAWALLQMTHNRTLRALRRAAKCAPFERGSKCANVGNECSFGTHSETRNIPRLTLTADAADLHGGWESRINKKTNVDGENQDLYYILFKLQRLFKKSLIPSSSLLPSLFASWPLGASDGGLTGHDVLTIYNKYISVLMIIFGKWTKSY